MTPKALNGRANHTDSDVLNDPRCPTCDQPLADKGALVEIFNRLSAHDAQIEQAITARFNSKLAEAERKKTAEIDRAVREAAKAVRDSQAATVAAAVRAERERSEKAAAVTLAAERSRSFSEKMSFEAQVNDLQRRLQHRTAGDLGDEGEINLFEILTAEFPDDEITRVPKGHPGPDIVHRVSGCGSTIVYDSKNHKVWANKWTTKLRDDMKMVSPAADHAVLVTTVFPKGEHRGLLHRDGIMVVSPTRVIPVAHLMRRHALQAHALRLSNEQRDEKTVQLYVLMTSNQTADLWERHSEALRSLVGIENSDSKHQEKTRNQRLEVISGLQSMIHEDLLVQMDRIISGAGLL